MHSLNINSFNFWELEYTWATIDEPKVTELWWIIFALDYQIGKDKLLQLYNVPSDVPPVHTPADLAVWENYQLSFIKSHNLMQEWLTIIAWKRKDSMSSFLTRAQIM